MLFCCFNLKGSETKNLSNLGSQRGDTVVIGPGNLKMSFSSASGQLKRMYNSRTGVRILQSSYSTVFPTHWTSNCHIPWSFIYLFWHIITIYSTFLLMVMTIYCHAIFCVFLKIYSIEFICIKVMYSNSMFKA